MKHHDAMIVRRLKIRRLLGVTRQATLYITIRRLVPCHSVIGDTSGLRRWWWRFFRTATYATYPANLSTGSEYRRSNA